MNQLLRMSHKLWLEAQLGAPDWAQNTVISFLHKAKELLHWRPYLTVQRLEGQNQGGSLIVDYVGLRYKPTWVDTLYTQKPKVRELGRVPIWQAHTLVSLAGSDLVIVANTTKGFVQRLPRQNSLTLPFRVKMTLNTQGSWEEVRSRLHKGIRHHELRLICRYGYEYEISRREEDFELFYHRMYLPTVKLRHKEAATPTSKWQAYQYFRHGWLHLIKRDGHYVAGGLSHSEAGNLITARLMGVLDADETLIKEVALGAYYYSIVHWANQEGYPAVCFGSCVPRLKDAFFQYKRKWGSSATYFNTVQKFTWIKIQHDTLAVRQFFKDTPLIISGEKGQLQGLIVVDNPSNYERTMQDELEKYYRTPGLGELVVCSIADLFNESQRPGKAGQSVLIVGQTGK